MNRRYDDARLEATIREHILRSTGVLEPDEPTAYSHAVYMQRMRADFTPTERQTIRACFGMGPKEGHGDG